MKRILIGFILFSLNGGAAVAQRTKIVPSNGDGQEQSSQPERSNLSPAPRSGGRTRIVPRQNSNARRPPAPITRGLTPRMGARQRTEIVPNQDYWDRVGGRRYVHRYHRGHHWYGFYHGPHFYWHRYHNNYWWWRDPHHDRWVYWWNGNWWWPGPAGVYLYVNNDYQPAPTVPPQVPAPPVNGTAPETAAGGSWSSPDGQRLVQISGANAEVFLYDATKDNPAFMKFLGQNAESVRFSGGADGKPLRILVNFKDGKFKMFDAAGADVES